MTTKEGFIGESRGHKKTWWGPVLGWLHDEEAQELIEADFDKYIEENAMKFRTMDVVWYISRKFRHRTATKKQK